MQIQDSSYFIIGSESQHCQMLSNSSVQLSAARKIRVEESVEYVVHVVYCLLVFHSSYFCKLFASKLMRAQFGEQESPSRDQVRKALILECLPHIIVLGYCQASTMHSQEDGEPEAHCERGQFRRVHFVTTFRHQARRASRRQSKD